MVHPVLALGTQHLGDLRQAEAARPVHQDLSEPSGVTGGVVPVPRRRAAGRDEESDAVVVVQRSGRHAAEAGQVAHQLWHEENPHVHGHDHPEIATTDEHKRLAERRVRLGLLLAEVGRVGEIAVTDAEMTQAVLAQARAYPGQERAFFEFVQKDPQMQTQIRAPIFEEKVVDHIIAQARITEKAVGKDELRAAVDALDEG